MQTTHVTDEAIDRFRRQQLPPVDFIAFTDHIASCGECRDRTLARSRAGAGLAAVEDGLEDLVDHVPESEIHAYVDGSVDASRRQEIVRHLDACPACAAEIRDLQAFAAHSRGSTRSRTMMFGALAAAALVVLAVGAALVFRMTPSSVEEGGLTARQREIVREARATGQVALPPVMSELVEGGGPLMGGSGAAPFELLAPIGTAVLDDRPTFRWTPVQGTAQYAVTVFDPSTGETRTSPSLTATEWTPPFALTRGRVYLWQIAATIDGRELVVPPPTAPPARVLVLHASTAADLERLPPSPLVRGILYADAGLIDDAERELAAVPAEDADAELAAGLLKQLRDAR